MIFQRQIFICIVPLLFQLFSLPPLFCWSVPVSNGTDATRLQASYESPVPIAIEGRSKPRAPLLFHRGGNSIPRSFLAATIARNYVKFNERNSAWKRAPLVISCEFMRESFGEEKKGGGGGGGGGVDRGQLSQRRDPFSAWYHVGKARRVYKL